MGIVSRVLFRGWAIIWISLLITVLIWITTLSDSSFIRQDPFLFFSKMVALPGTVGMCWTFILSTRLRVLEDLFSGLDKVYHAHRTMGIVSFCLICLHPLFQVFRFLPNWNHGMRLFLVQELGPIEFGLFAFILFIVLITLTLWVKIPYHIWKKTHELFICVLLLGLIHIVWINKQINASLLLSIWFYGFIFLAITSYIYIRYLYRYLGPRFIYRIERIEKKGKVWNFELKPTQKKMVYKPAQFIYISFDNPKVSSESHPYSISSSPDQDCLRISIKSLGDYTAKLGSLCVGDKATLWGAYGHFYEKFICEKEKDLVLIAGGIGITPFLSILHFEAKRLSNRKIHLFYCVKNSSRAYFHSEIEGLAKSNHSIHYNLWCSDTQGFMDVQDIAQKMGGDLNNKLYFLCGPLPMMDLFIRELNQKGVKSKYIRYEDFNLLD